MRRCFPLLLLGALLFAGRSADGAESLPRATWVWDGWKILSQPAQTSELFAFCEKPPSSAPRIDTLYLSIPALHLRKEGSIPVVTSFLKQAHSRGIRVELLAGAPEMAYQKTAGIAVIEGVQKFNRAAPEDSKFDGIHFDIEPHTLGIVWTRDDRLRDRFVESIKIYRETFLKDRGNMRLGYDIAVDYGEDPVLFNALLDGSDYLAVMDYRDSSGMIVALGEDILKAASQKGKPVILGVETQKPNRKYGVTPMLTFWDEGSVQMEKALADVERNFQGNPAFMGIAIHHYGSYATLTPDRQTIVDNRKFPVLSTVEARHLSGTVKIDGSLAEWTPPPTLEVASAKEVVYGKPTWKSPDDLSAKAWVAWDQDALYFAADVIDDTVVQPFETRKMVNGDHLELWLDLNYEQNKDSGTAGPGVYQLGLSPGNFSDIAPGIYEWIPGLSFRGHETELKIASTKTKMGYSIEMRIPWALLGEFKPEPGKPFRINVDPSDTDGTDKPFQETLMSSSPHREWGNPKTFRMGVFKESGK